MVRLMPATLSDFASVDRISQMFRRDVERHHVPVEPVLSENMACSVGGADMAGRDGER